MLDHARGLPKLTKFLHAPRLKTLIVRNWADSVHIDSSALKITGKVELTKSQIKKMFPKVKIIYEESQVQGTLCMYILYVVIRVFYDNK